MIYFVVFFVVSALVQYGSTSKLNVRKICSLVAAVVILALLVGLRDVRIGTDSLQYATLFNIAKRYSQMSFLFDLRSTNIESGFLVTEYICSRIFSDFHGFFFVCGLIVYGFIVKTIYDYRNEIIPGLAWLGYAFLYFGDSLNALRQSMALAIIFFGFRFIREKKIISYLICIAVASMFHQTAIIGIAFYFIYIIMLMRTHLFQGLAIIIGAIVISMFYEQILQITIDYGIVTVKLLRYMMGSEMSLRITSLLVRLVGLVPVILFWKRYSGKTEEASWFLVMMLLDILMYNMSTINTTLYRLAMYTGVYRVFGYASLCKYLPKNEKIIMILYYMFYFMMTFFYQVILNNVNEIYPYMLGI